MGSVLKDDFRSNLHSGDRLVAGDHDYRAYVGAPENYDLLSAAQFNLLTRLGLREYHRVLDIGCGSLRVGKLLIPYLLPQHYYGIEPNGWLLDEGISREIGKDLIRLKQPHFNHDNNFTLSIFGEQFDFLLAQSIFSHTSISQLKRCLSEAGKVMKPTSVFLATYLPGETNYQGTEWVYPQCITYTPKFLEEITGQFGLSTIHLPWAHPGDQHWIAITHPSNLERVSGMVEPGGKEILEDRIRQLKNRLAKIESYRLVRLGIQLRKAVRKLKK